MLAEAVKLNILNNHHLIIFYVEDCAVNYLLRRHPVSYSEFFIHPSYSIRCVFKPLTLRVFSNLKKYLPYSFFNTHIATFPPRI